MTDVAVVTVPCALAAALVLVRGPRPARRLVAKVERGSPLERYATAVLRVASASRRRRSEPAAVGAWVEAWAAAVRAGRPAELALGDAFADVAPAQPLLPRTFTVVGVGGEVATAMRLDAAVLAPSVGRTVLAAAACWTVARDNGGRLADALDRLGDTVRADSVHVAHVRAQLAGPRATARLLAALPLFALVLGTAMGLDPVSVLVGEPLGRWLLAVGLVLDVAGLCWTEQLARAAERTA